MSIHFISANAVKNVLWVGLHVNNDIYRTVTKKAGKHTHTEHCKLDKRNLWLTATMQQHYNGRYVCHKHTHRVKRMGLCDINRISNSSLNSTVALFHEYVNSNLIYQDLSAHTHTHTHLICGDKDRFQSPHLILYMTQQPSKERNWWTQLFWKECKNQTQDAVREFNLGIF